MGASVGSAVVAEHLEHAPDASYGVFDTLLVRAGRALDLERHVGRLTSSVAELYAVPVDAPGLAARIAAGAFGMELGRVRTSYHPIRDEWEIESTPIEEPEPGSRTLTPLRLPGGLGRHKWRDRRLVEGPRDADDVLLVDDADDVLECGTANVFLVLDGEVVTPPLDGRILPGTVRARVLEMLAGEGRAAAERPVTLSALRAADEVFTTSSIRGVRPVVGCLGVGAWAAGPTADRLRHDR
jgi:para-aminobenzoate synthetase / 4-amino-4-deoxychorismate lyase